MKFNLWLLLIPVFGLIGQQVDYNTQLKNAPYKTVVAYGDGTHGDSALIQAAINRVCAQASGREVYLPAPAVNYVIDTTITMACDGIWFHSSGVHAKIFIKDTVAVGISTNKHSYTKIEGLQLYGTGNIANQVCVYVDSTGTSTGGNTITNNIIGTCGVKPPLTISGAAVKVRGDNLELEISRNVFSVWGTGLDFDSTNDLLNVHDNVFGTDATTNDSGYGITMVNSAGAGRQRFYHNNFVTPGGIANFGGLNGGIIFNDNQYENLAGTPNLSNGASTAITFGSASKYEVRGNNIGLHSHGNYCFNTNSFSGGIFADNACYNSSVAQWNNSGIGYGTTFENNNDGTGNPAQVVYTNPAYPGVKHASWSNNNIGHGTTNPQSIEHFNNNGVPYTGDTTLAAAIATTSVASITVTSATNITVGDIIYIDTEQFAVYAKAGAVLSVSRGENSTTAATHLINAPVTFGPGGGILITNPKYSTISLALGVEAGFAYLKARQLSGINYLPIPLNLDLLTIQSQVAGQNTKVIIKGIAGQADYPLQYQNSAGLRQFSISNAGVITSENLVAALNEYISLGGISTFVGAQDSVGAFVGSFSNHPFDLYSNSIKHISLPVDGGLKLIAVSSPTCDISHVGTFFYVDGTPSLVKACMRSSTNTYGYVTIVTAP